MNVADTPLVWIGLLVIVAAVCCVVIAYRLTPKNRERRKRMKNYGRVVTRTRRPLVMLNARVPKA
jgi:ABC-type transporter Mla subunit MlaD